MNSVKTFTDLPLELLAQILSSVTGPDLQILSRVCKVWNTLAIDILSKRISREFSIRVKEEPSSNSIELTLNLDGREHNRGLSVDLTRDAQPCKQESKTSQKIASFQELICINRQEGFSFDYWFILSQDHDSCEEILSQVRNGIIIQCDVMPLFNRMSVSESTDSPANSLAAGLMLNQSFSNCRINVMSESEQDCLIDEEYPLKCLVVVKVGRVKKIMLRTDVIEKIRQNNIPIASFEASNIMFTGKTSKIESSELTLISFQGYNISAATHCLSNLGLDDDDSNDQERISSCASELLSFKESLNFNTDATDHLNHTIGFIFGSASFIDKGFLLENLIMKTFSGVKFIGTRSPINFFLYNRPYSEINGRSGVPIMDYRTDKRTLRVLLINFRSFL